MSYEIVEIESAIETHKETVTQNLLTQMEFFGHMGQLDKIASARDQATAIQRKHRTDLNTDIKKAREEVLTCKNQRGIKQARDEWKSLLDRKSNLSDKINDLSEPYKQPAKLKAQAMESCLIDMLAQVHAITGIPIVALEGIPEKRLNKMIAIESAKKRQAGQIISVAPIQI